MAVPSIVAFGSGLLLTSLVCLGTWPALLRLSSTLPSPRAPRWCCVFTENDRSYHCRDARFAYLDYAFAYVISSSIPLVISLWMMESVDDEEDSDGESENNNILPQQFPLILFALCGGSLLSLGNISMQWSVTVFGAPLTTVLAIQASLTVTLGTSINYILQPEKTSHPDLLLLGVLVFLIAIVLATRAHLLYGHEQQQQEENLKGYYDQKSILGIEMNEEPHTSYGSLESTDSLESSTESSSSLGKRDSPILVVDNVVSMNQVGEFDYTSAPSSHSPRMALLVAIFGGCCFGFFSPAFNVAVNDPFHFTGDEHEQQQYLHLHPLSVPIANLWFSVAFTIASFLGNIPLMYYPPTRKSSSSSDIDDNCTSHLLLPRVTLTEYVHGGESFSERKLAIYAGLLCGIANLLQFQGGNIVGFATADLVQAYPLVSTIWDIVLFGEYRNAGRTVIFYLTTMYVMYTCGIGFLISSANEG